MAKVLIERAGRCLGGDNNIQVALIEKRHRGQYQTSL